MPPHHLQYKSPLVAVGTRKCHPPETGTLGGWGQQRCPCHLCAVVVMASTISMMRCSAESVPMVMSVPQKSLSMEPTMPTMFRWLERCASSAVMPPGERGGQEGGCHTQMVTWRVEVSQGLGDKTPYFCVEHLDFGTKTLGIKPFHSLFSSCGTPPKMSP